MKKSSGVSMLVVTTVIIAVSSCAVNSHIEIAKGVDLHNYKTFTWKQKDIQKNNQNINSDIVDDNIKEAATEQLEKKGWQQVNKNADVLLDYNIAIANTTKRQNNGSYPYSSMGYGGRSRFYSMIQPSYNMGSRSIPVKEGVLTIDITDAKTNKLIWQGWAADEVNKSKITSKQATADVKSILKKLDSRS